MISLNPMTSPTNSISFSVWQNAEVEKGVVQGNASNVLGIALQVGTTDSSFWNQQEGNVWQSNNIDVDIKHHFIPVW